MGFDEKVAELVRTHEARQSLTPPTPKVIPEERRELDVATMSKSSLVTTVTKNPFQVTELINQRPTMVGELIQHSLQTHNPAAATTLMSGFKTAYRAGSGRQRELLFRSVMRVQGHGSAEIRQLLRKLVEQEQLPSSEFAHRGIGLRRRRSCGRTVPGQLL
jgi:hypothetical protein